MNAVYAVVIGNYEPPEVVALYDNEDAARAHASIGDNVGVRRWEVASHYPLAELPPQATETCACCGHVLSKLGNEYACVDHCHCTMAGCMPNRLVS